MVTDDMLAQALLPDDAQALLEAIHGRDYGTKAGTPSTLRLLCLGLVFPGEIAWRHLPTPTGHRVAKILRKSASRRLQYSSDAVQ